MSTYKEQRENLQYYVLLKDGDVLGTFGNLKKIIEFLDGKDFYSYHTLVRKEFPLEHNNYKIFKVKHY